MKFNPEEALVGFVQFSIVLLLGFALPLVLTNSCGDGMLLSDEDNSSDSDDKGQEAPGDDDDNDDNDVTEEEFQQELNKIDECPQTTEPSTPPSEETLAAMEAGMVGDNGLAYKLLTRDRQNWATASSTCTTAELRLPTVRELQEFAWLEDVPKMRCGNHDWVAWSSEKLPPRECADPPCPFDEIDRYFAVKIDNAKEAHEMTGGTNYHTLCVKDPAESSGGTDTAPLGCHVCSGGDCTEHEAKCDGVKQANSCCAPVGADCAPIFTVWQCTN